jgi:hypothetical protein
MSRPSVIVSMPCARTVEAPCAANLAVLMYRLGMLTQQQVIERAWTAIILDTVLPRGRTLIAHSAIDAGATHILWLDSDMCFPPDIAEKLLSWEEPLVGCNYPQRREPFEPTAKALGGELIWTTEAKHDENLLEPAYYMGLGAMLTAVEVFTTVPKPWFRMAEDEKGGWVGEDAFFFLKAREYGFAPKIDHDLSWTVQHISDIKVTWEGALEEKRCREQEKPTLRVVESEESDEPSVAGDSR